MQLIERVKREDNKRVFKFAQAKRKEFYELIVIFTTDHNNLIEYIELNLSSLGIGRWGRGGKILLCQRWETEAEAGANAISKKITSSLLRTEHNESHAQQIFHSALEKIGNTQLQVIIEKFCQGIETELFLQSSEFIVEQVKDLAENVVQSPSISLKGAHITQDLDLNRIDDNYLGNQISRLRSDNLPLKEFAARLSQITKKKVRALYGITAEAMTKKTLIRQLSLLNIAPHIRSAIDEVLNFCENAIYANHDYSDAEILRIEKKALTIVEQLEPGGVKYL